MGRKRYWGPDRRPSLRLAYPPEHRAVLATRSGELEVLDISPKGLCLLNPEEIPYAGWFRGLLKFLNGDCLAVAGQVAWQKHGCVGVHLTVSGVSPALILKEQNHLAHMTSIVNSTI